jgi:hypothetical protein
VESVGEKVHCINGLSVIFPREKGLCPRTFHGHGIIDGVKEISM